MPHSDQHKSNRNSWLRAAVMGANDGIVSTASLIIGVAAAQASQDTIVITGLAGLVAGAMSMAAGEYVSVSSQADTQKADLALEQQSLEENYQYEEQELTNLYIKRGVSPPLARQVAQQLMAQDALGTHAREEIGLTDIGRARPLLAAATSATTFAIGAGVPLLGVLWSRGDSIIVTVVVMALVCLCCLGYLSAKVGGAATLPAIVRVLFWGALAMLLTAVVGLLFSV